MATAPPLYAKTYEQLFTYRTHKLDDDTVIKMLSVPGGWVLEKYHRQQFVYATFIAKDPNTSY